MTVPQTDATTDPQSVIATLRQRLDTALSEKATLAEALARRNTEFGERIEQQSATIDVLKVMSASPGDTQPVFDLIVGRAKELCGVPFAAVISFDGKQMHLSSWTGGEGWVNRDAWEAYERLFPLAPTRGSISGRAILDRAVVHVRDMTTQRGIMQSVRSLGHKSQISVPLLRDSTALGVIVLSSPEVGGFSENQVALLQTFAEQAVIAITSAETYRALQTRTSDLQETLEYQTATSEVLKVISRSTFDLQPILDTLVETAARLCEADSATVMRRHGDVYRAAAAFGYSPEFEAFIESHTFAPGQGSITGRVALGGRAVHVVDAANDPQYTWTEGQQVGKFRTMLGVPLLREDALIGVIVLARSRVEPFTDRQIELVSTFADQAVIAIENTRLLTEQREALEQQTAMAEVLQTINASAGDLTPVFEAILEKANRLCEADMGTFWTFDGERFFPSVTSRNHPLDHDSPAMPEGWRPGPNVSLGRVIAGEDVVHVVDVSVDAGYQSDIEARSRTSAAGTRSGLTIALRSERRLLGAITTARRTVRPFSDRQIALLENFAAQAVIAMENARLINEQREALEQQTATAEVLQVINTSPGDLAPVFDALLEKAMRLCGAAFGSLYTYDGEHFHSAAQRGVPPAYAAFRAQNPPTTTDGGPAGIFETRRPHHVLDLKEQETYRTGNPGVRAMVELGGIRTILTVPLIKDDAFLGVITIYRQEVRAFTDKQISLLENFAAQAVIAMENARLITETQEALEQQTATAEVLQVINASPGNLTPVFDTMLEKAMRLCGATIGGIYRYNGQRFDTVALRGVTPGFAAFSAENPMSTIPGGPPSVVLETKRAVQVVDIAATDRYRDGSSIYGRALVDIGGIRAVLNVPLLKDGAVLGLITIYRAEPGAFSDKQIALLESFAAQAVIAMENARLINEQREALDRQTATAEVLQVINSSPGNLMPVFDAILEKAHRLCGADVGALGFYDGAMFRSVAMHGFPEAHAARARQPWVPTPHQDPLVRGERMVHVADLKAEGPEWDNDITRSANAGTAIRTGLWLPLRKDGVLQGYISSFRNSVRPFSDNEISLLENFAEQAVIAIENARLLNEVQQRQEELRITFENMGDGVAMFDETQHLVAWNRKFQEIFNVPDALLEEHRTYAEYVRYLGARGDFGPTVDVEEQIRRFTETAGEYHSYERVRPDGRVIEIRHNPVPGGGFVLIYADITERKRNEAEIRAARDAAEEASRAIEAAYRELKTAQANLIQAEKMASLGQLTAGIAHEIKNPLNFVNNFSALSTELIDELRDVLAPEPLGETARTEVDDLTALLKGNLEKVVQHGQRADGIVRSMLDHSRGSSGERRMVDLNALIDEALNLAYHGARAQDQSFNITLERDFGAGIAPIEVNPQDITRVFLNLFSNGFYAVARRAREGGDAGFVPTLKVTTVDAGEAVEIRVRDNGTGIPADIRDKLFQPFFTTKPTGEGTGLGLSITYDIVTQQHGGSIAVESEVGEYSEFTIRLPRNP